MLAGLARDVGSYRSNLWHLLQMLASLIEAIVLSCLCEYGKKANMDSREHCCMTTARWRWSPVALRFWSEEKVKCNGRAPSRQILILASAKLPTFAYQLRQHHDFLSPSHRSLCHHTVPRAFRSASAHSTESTIFSSGRNRCDRSWRPMVSSGRRRETVPKPHFSLQDVTACRTRDWPRHCRDC